MIRSLIRSRTGGRTRRFPPGSRPTLGGVGPTRDACPGRVPSPILPVSGRHSAPLRPPLAMPRFLPVRAILSRAILSRGVLLPALLLTLSACADPPEDPAPRLEQDGVTIDDAALDAAPEWLADLIRSDPTAEPQAISLLGEPLHAREDDTGEVAEADAALLGNPDDVELLIAAGRVRRNHWQYRQAMELYSRAAELAPDDWRPVRFRGHRHLSVREFDQGIRDLERARTLAPLNWDVSYHLGLGYFLDGRFDDAASEYLRCLELADDPDARAASEPGFRSCSENADDPESMVAMVEWTVRALERAGRMEEARSWVERIPADLPIQENIAYYHNLLMDQGVMTEDELLSPGPDGPYRLETVGYGVATRRLARGDIEGAEALLRRLMEDEWWPGFGRLAAEADLARLERRTP